YFFNIRGLKDKRFPPEIEIALFRIVQEAVVNISKHSDAENVVLDMEANDDFIRMEIRDDGRGFDMGLLFDREGHHLRDGRGLGIMGMKERASLINGNLEIISSPGEGCTVSLTIPLKSLEKGYA
ncbi:MAG: ATP-binding protein, partial [Candidatus Aenigmatarchaeota archaeon]